MEADRLSGSSGRSRRDAHRGFPGYEGAVQGSLPGSRSSGFRLAPKKHWRAVTELSVWPRDPHEKNAMFTLGALVSNRAILEQPPHDDRHHESEWKNDGGRYGDQPGGTKQWAVVVVNRVKILRPSALRAFVVPMILEHRGGVFVCDDFDVHVNTSLTRMYPKHSRKASS